MAAHCHGVGLLMTLLLFSSCTALPRDPREPDLNTMPDYLKASNTASNSGFGFSVATSGDTLVVGAPFASGPAAGPRGARAQDDSDPFSRPGAAYVFRCVEGRWRQEACLNSTGAGGGFGWSVAISGDAIVVGSPAEWSPCRGINQPLLSIDDAKRKPDQRADQSGAAHVYRRIEGKWVPEATFKASNASSGHEFGKSVSISGDLVVVGAPRESGGVRGSLSSGEKTESLVMEGAGAAYVFRRDRGQWSEEAYLKGTIVRYGAFGFSVSIDGPFAVIGEPGGPEGGEVFLFRREGAWVEADRIRTPVKQADARFGASTALHGGTLVIGSPEEGAPQKQLKGARRRGVASPGAAYVYEREGQEWRLKARLQAPHSDVAGFGYSISLSAEELVVGVFSEDSGAIGLNGNITAPQAANSGAAYLFSKAAGAWSFRAHLKASNPGSDDMFGASVAISGARVVVGAINEGSCARGVNAPRHGGKGTQQDDSMLAAGAAYVFSLR